jgi:hypothetical protein
MSPKTLKVTIIILFVLVFLSLGLNLYLIWELIRVQQQAYTLAREYIPTIQATLSQAADNLQTFQGSTLEFEVKVNEEFPVDVEIPINETIEVPIQVSVPIRQEFETTIVMDPLQSGLEIPVDVTVPVDVEIPVDVVVPVVIDRVIPISTTVPLALDVPIVVEMDKIELTGYLEQFQMMLISINSFLDQVLADIQ